MDEKPNTIEITPADSQTPGIVIPESLLRFTFSRSGGPGGQNVNKLNTKATLTVSLEDLQDYLDTAALGRLRKLAGSKLTSDDRLLIQCEESRSQTANKTECIERLRELIARASVKPKRRRKTKPSRAARERRLREKKQRGEIKKSRSQRYE